MTDVGHSIGSYKVSDSIHGSFFGFFFNALFLPIHNGSYIILQGKTLVILNGKGNGIHITTRDIRLASGRALSTL